MLVLQRQTGLGLASVLLLTAGLLSNARAAEPKLKIPLNVSGKFLTLISPQRAAKFAKTDLTFELWVRPNKVAVNRARCNIFCLTNRGGSDVKSISLSLHKGRIHCTVLGAYIAASNATKLPQDKWTHVALTLNTKTVNKRARLWINGKRVAQILVPEPFPTSFYYAGLFGDPWIGTRILTGSAANIRLSKTVRYTKAFKPPVTIKRDAQTLVILPK